MTLHAAPDLFAYADTRVRTGADLRDEALDMLEAARLAYVMRERAVAEAIYARKGWVCVDDIRAECPPPSDIDGRVLGCVLRKRDGWIVDETRKVFSGRKLNHGKRIAAFVKRGNV